MVALRAAAAASDAALDWALLRVGILAPAELDGIRELLMRSATLRATVNGDGHRILEIVEQGTLVARIHHDGRVSGGVATDTAA